MPEASADLPPNLLCYEQLLDNCFEQLPGFTWPQLDENTPAGLCYTSGTTGNPKVCKGVTGCILCVVCCLKSPSVPQTLSCTSECKLLACLSLLVLLFAVQGVRYTHRSNFLHSFVVTQPDSLCLGAADSMLMVVPMFHANSWGVNFAGEEGGNRTFCASPHMLIGSESHQPAAAASPAESAGCPCVAAKATTITKHRL